MRDLSNFDGAECEELERDIRAMCDKLKFAAPPSEYSIEGAIEKVIPGRVNHPAAAGLLKTSAGFFRPLAAVFTAQRLSNFASSMIVFVMLMIIPLALFSNNGMAMSSAQAHSRDRGTQVNDEDLKLKCTQYQCGDKRYEK